jgi:lethal(3)malignant brain tumor-like protein
MFDGEMIPLNQLHQHVLEQNLPEKILKKHRTPIIPDKKFQWDTYLSSKSVPAPINLFKNPYPRSANPFRSGMKLEAIDPFSQKKSFCICTVEEKLGYRIKLHFDGYSNAYDFWANVDSQNIFPAGFCQSTKRYLQVPPKWNGKKFDWSEYLDRSNSIGAQKSMFPHLLKTYDNPMEKGMKIEASHRGKRTFKIKAQYF